MADSTTLVADNIGKPARKRRKHARPAELLEAALVVFARDGFHAASIEEIGALAGVSKGTVYLYFRSKEGLFMSAIRSVVDPLLGKGEFAAAEWTGTMSSLLQQLVQGWRELVRAYPIGEVLKLMLSETKAFPSLAKEGEVLIERVHVLVKGLIEKGIRNGEFRPCDAIVATQVILAPLGLREVCRHSPVLFGAAWNADDAFLKTYTDLVLRSLENC